MTKGMLERPQRKQGLTRKTKHTKALQGKMEGKVVSSALNKDGSALPIFTVHAET